MEESSGQNQRTGTRIGKYEIRRTVGRGGIGVVYEAWDVVLKRRVAVKTLPLLGLDTDLGQEKYQRFQREAQAAARLYHPNIAITFDYGETDALAYIVMEYLDGPSVKELIDKRSVRADQVRTVMQGLLAGLQHSHDQGIVHRDIKPANMLLSKDGEVKITDFGIAHLEDSDLTQLGSQVGTPAYMPPEQVLGKKVDARSDLYSAGVVLYEMVTGRRPFVGSTTSVMHKILNVPAPRLSESTATFPPALDAVVAKALAKDPEDRYASANEFWQALNGHLHPAPPAQPPIALEQAASDLTIVREPEPKVHSPPVELARPPAPQPISMSPRVLLPLVGAASLVVMAALWFSFHRTGSHPTPAKTQVSVASGPAKPRVESPPVVAATPAPAKQATTPEPVRPADAGQSQQTAAVAPVKTQAAGPSPEFRAGLEEIASKIPCTFLRTDFTGATSVALSGVTALGEASEIEIEGDLRRSVAQLSPDASVAWKVQRVTGPYCSVLETLRSLESGRSAGHAVSLAITGPAVTSDNPPPQARVVMPDFAASLLVDFYSNDGTVHHLYPAGGDSSHNLSPGSEVNFARPDPASVGANGGGLLTAIASSKPLPGPAHPSQESTSVYLKDLAAATALVRAAGASIEADAIGLPASVPRRSD
jgi:serine/threonine-protein kinase